MTSPSSSAKPQPVLSIIGAVGMTIGIVIGAGIFRAPSIVAGADDNADRHANGADDRKNRLWFG